MSSRDFTGTSPDSLGSSLEDVLWLEVPWADDVTRRKSGGDTLPVVWQPTGNITCDVNIPKAGRGSTLVEAVGDGVLQRVHLSFDPRRVRDPHEEKRRALVLQH